MTSDPEEKDSVTAYARRSMVLIDADEAESGEYARCALSLEDAKFLRRQLDEAIAELEGREPGSASGASGGSGPRDSLGAPPSGDHGPDFTTRARVVSMPEDGDPT